ncbi:glycoside hydrolase family 5 protein [Suillus paluster]|uniref:glycoside hydrolase family 5 protein n=1 Tax=Suillus paluster TaxID=48578 RepID=UPI001B85BA58|nr:glycoside hydrolase family 5 protein [Suillus paluster]KAG1754937.1 glycoside hydrolase family 5 protein [Suillus paluster]
MPLLNRLVNLAVLGVSAIPPVLSFQPGFSYGSEKVRGVSLGGWLVLEPWITPSIFENTGNNNIVDEWTFGEYQDYDTAKAVLQDHWNSWITESDFEAIAAAGLNHVRLPIGYWAFEVGAGEPYITGQLDYMKSAITWASNYGLKLVIDLHGAPGSQNGYDNSGQRMSYPTWHSNQTNVDRTDSIIKTIISIVDSEYETVPTIGPLNEPAGYDGDDVLEVVKQYWYDSYPYGSSTESNTVELIHDAFQSRSYWDGFMTDGYDGVAMDTHIYQMFSDEVAYNYSQHIEEACSQGSNLASYDLWVIVGEWTPASTDCATWLNGRGTGARYDGSMSGSSYVGSCTGKSGNATSFSSDYKTFMRQYWEAQVISYEKGDGWIQWTWKAENADDWSYQAGLKYGWIPQDPTDLEYPNICD